MARNRISRLTSVNNLIEQNAIKDDNLNTNKESKIQIAGLLKTIEYDFTTLLNGVSLAFLCAKAQEVQRPHLPIIYRHKKL